VSACFPASIQLVRNGEVPFRAEMQSDATAPNREPSRCGEGGWEGPVYLPDNGRAKDRRGKLFFARIRGYTQTYPFLHPKDSVTIGPSRDRDVFQALIDSGFVAKEWGVRQDATHAKSKTYHRTDSICRSAEV
jgi:hypothetical protein